MISKKEEEEILKWVDDYKLEKERKRWHTGKIVLRCSTVATAISATLLGIGSWAADNIVGIEAAARAFIEVKRGAQ